MRKLPLIIILSLSVLLLIALPCSAMGDDPELFFSGNFIYWSYDVEPDTEVDIFATTHNSNPVWTKIATVPVEENSYLFSYDIPPYMRIYIQYQGVDGDSYRSNEVIIGGGYIPVTLSYSDDLILEWNNPYNYTGTVFQVFYSVDGVNWSHQPFETKTLFYKPSEVGYYKVRNNGVDSNVKRVAFVKNWADYTMPSLNTSEITLFIPPESDVYNMLDSFYKPIMDSDLKNYIATAFLVLTFFAFGGWFVFKLKDYT